MHRTPHVIFCPGHFYFQPRCAKEKAFWQRKEGREAPEEGTQALFFLARTAPNGLTRRLKIFARETRGENHKTRWRRGGGQERSRGPSLAALSAPTLPFLAPCRHLSVFMHVPPRPPLSQSVCREPLVPENVSLVPAHLVPVRENSRMGTDYVAPHGGCPLTPTSSQALVSGRPVRG